MNIEILLVKLIGNILALTFYFKYKRKFNYDLFITLFVLTYMLGLDKSSLTRGHHKTNCHLIQNNREHQFISKGLGQDKEEVVVNST